MYEVVKVVKGYEVTRMVGSRGIYRVAVRKSGGCSGFYTFRTIKSAVEFIEKAL